MNLYQVEITHVGDPDNPVSPLESWPASIESVDDDSIYLAELPSFIEFALEQDGYVDMFWGGFHITGEMP